jgi:hypothetical protein
LAEKGHALPPPPVDDGSDNEHGVINGGAAGGNIDQVTSDLWRQFLIDVANKAPNPRGAAHNSYSKLSHDERCSVGEDYYKNNKLRELWNSCHWKMAEKSEWTRAFDHLFPVDAHVTHSKAQNYQQCLYYMRWKEISGELRGANQRSLDAMRRSLRRRLDTLSWIPDACQDKMWPTTRPANSRFKRYPIDSTGPAPRLLFRVHPVETLVETEENQISEAELSDGQAAMEQGP